MFPFSREPKDPQPEAAAPAPKQAEAHPLDGLTGGVFSAATSGERAQRVRDWLASDPAPEQMQEVYKELSSKDKGAAKALREKLEELRRAKGQEAVAAEWEAKGQALLQAARLNIADSLAWQRDAAKAGAPLSREPLAGLRAQLVDRIKKVEDLQQRVMVQREAAVMLSQRIELLSTKPLADAQAQQTGLASDVEQWRSHARLLLADPQWLSVDVRYPPQLEAAQTQLLAVRDAFVAALDQAAAAAQDKSAPLPSVPVWADELRAARGEPPAAAAVAEEAAAKAAPKPRVDPEQRNAAQKAVEAGVKLLEQAVAAGHTKNMHSATAALRQSLKAHGRLIDDALEARVHATLVSAGELEGWQRWSADKVREQLVAQAEALLTKRKIKGTQGASAAANARANEATTATEEAGAMQAAAAQDAHAPEVSTDNAAEGAEAPAAPEGAVAESSPNAQANAATTATEEAGAREEAAAETAATESEATAVGSTSAAGQSGAESAVAEDAISANAQANEATTATEQAGAMEEAAAERSQRPVRPSPADTLEPGYELVPAMGGRKLQDTIRKLRDEWKAADQGGAPNHALWKRFDRAINAAHKHVDEWLSKVRAEAAEHKAQRQALIDEVKAFGAAHAGDGEGADWKAFNRQIHQFSDRWRNAGHLSEKAFAELQGKWKEAIHAAAAPLETAQKHSTARRQGLIAEAEALGAAAQLRIDAVRSLQQRWQAEAQAVPLERKHEQRLWDAFRKPLDEAFNRKGAEREKQQAAMSEHDRAVLDAAKALEEANASGDANRIRTAMAALEAATRAQPAPAATEAPKSEEKTAPAPADGAPDATENAVPADAAASAESPADASSEAPATGGEAADGAAAPAPAAPPAPAKPAKPAKPVVAMRGDDRPGAKRPEAAPAGRGGKFGDRRDGRPGPGGRDARGGPGAGGRGGDRFGDRRDGGRDGGRFGDRGPREDRGPRLGDAAFRAQRDAVEHAQAQLRKLAAQAHGETVTQLIGAWAARQPEQLPSAQELGKGVSGSTRTAWAQAVQSAPQGSASEALLRLEMAADVPTPADQLDARRALQLKLLTRRNDPSPAETWANDAGAVLGTAHDEATARRLQNALKVLMRK